MSTYAHVMSLLLYHSYIHSFVLLLDADFSKCVLEGKTPRVVKGHPPGHLRFWSSVIDLGAI